MRLFSREWASTPPLAAAGLRAAYIYMQLDSYGDRRASCWHAMAGSPPWPSHARTQHHAAMRMRKSAGLAAAAGRKHLAAIL